MFKYAATGLDWFRFCACDTDWAGLVNLDWIGSRHTNSFHTSELTSPLQKSVVQGAVVFVSLLTSMTSVGGRL